VPFHTKWASSQNTLGSDNNGAQDCVT